MKILGPAGGREAFDAALAAGADEIYMGLAGYGARRFAANFSTEEFCRALDDAHRLGVGINLTLNTVMATSEMDRVFPDVKRLYEAGLDGILVQDWGVLHRIASEFPDLPIHGSTQMALANRREVLFAESIGISRVVLPRELSFEEIASIRRGTDLELEVFCSGALCLACSGKCYLSSFVGGRSGNRGACAQPCRQAYRQRTGSETSARPESGYLLSLKDQLHGEPEIRRLLEIGVDVIKIEGRMKSPAYVYEAVRHFRRILDRITGRAPEISAKMFFIKEDGREKTSPSEPKSSGWRGKEISGKERDPSPERVGKENLPKLFNRGYGKGFLYDHDPEILQPNYASHYGVLVGEVHRDGILLSDSLAFGDGVVYLDEDYHKIGGMNVSDIRRQPRLYGEKPVRVPEAFSGDLVQIGTSDGSSNGSVITPPPVGARFLYKTFDQLLQKDLTRRIQQTRRHRPIRAELRARVGQPLQWTLTLLSDDPENKGNASKRSSVPFRTRGKAVSVSVESDQPLEKSLKRKNDRESVLSSMDRFGETPFFLAETDLDLDPDAFIPKSLLNALRQEASVKLENRILEISHRSLSDTLRKEGTSISSLPPPSIPSRPVPSLSTEWSAVVRTIAQGLAASLAGIRKIYLLKPPVRFEENANRWLARMESIQAEEIEKSGAGEKIENETPSLPFRPAVLASSLVEAIYYQERGIPFATDGTFNVGNRESALFLLDRFPHLRTLFLSPELGRETINALYRDLSPILAARGGRVGLSVYGHPSGMFTRKTISESAKSEWENQDGRRFVIARNDGWFYGESEMTGNSIYYAPPNDILSDARILARSDGWELRFDFTLESPEKITETVRRALSPENADSPSRSSTGYGFSHPIF